MKFKILLFCCFFSCFCIAQQLNFNNAVSAYDEEDYVAALNSFEKLQTAYKNNKDTLGVIKCLTYQSKIKNLQSDYKSAITISDNALQLFKSTKNDSLYAEIQSNKALSLKALGDFKAAFNTSNILINHLNSKVNVNSVLANAYQIKSRIEIDLGNYENAINSAKKALTLTSKEDKVRQAALLNIIGVGFYFKDELDSTSQYYNASYKIKKAIKADDYQLAITTYNIGIVEEDLGNYDEAIAFYNKAAQHDLNDRGEAVGFLSDIYVALTNTYFKKNDLEKAEEYADKALRVALKRYGEDSPNTSFVYVAYSNIFELKGEDEKNLEYIKKALQIRRKTYGDRHRWTAESLLSISEAQIKLKDYDNAIKNYNEAISIAKSINNEVVQSYAEMGLATIYTKTKQLNLAEKAIKTSKEGFAKAYGKYHETYLSVLIIEAEFYIEKKQLSKALQIIEEIKANVADSNLFYLLDAKLLKLKIGKQEFNATGNSDLLEQDLLEIDASIEMMDAIRKDFPTSKSKIYVNGIMHDYIANAIEAVYHLYTKTNDFSYVEKAFKLSELNRSRTLASGIMDVRFKKMTNIPKAILEQENKLNRTLANLKQELHYEEQAEKPDVDYINEVLSTQLQKRQALDSLLGVMEQDYPKYYHLKYSASPVAIKALQKEILEPDETVIEYFLSEDFVFAFCISKSKVQFKKMARTKETVAKIKALRIALKSQKPVTENAKGLYNDLLKNLELETDRLIIIPDGELNQLPFEILMSENDYLVQDYTISYSGSASLILTQQDDFFNFKFTTDWTGFAPNFQSNSSLTANQSEIKSIAKIMKGITLL